MADSIFRKLRDGGEEGELAPALTIEDTVASPFGLDVFSHLVECLSSAILAGKSNSQGLVLITFSRSPSFYLKLLKRKGIEVSSSSKWIHILDCYTDPLGWKDQLPAIPREGSSFITLYKPVSDVRRLFSSIAEVGRELVGDGKTRFCVAIDSVNELLRNSSMPSVAGLLTDLRSHAQVSSIFWSLNTVLHEARATSALEYISTMVANLEPLCPTSDGQTGSLKNLALLHQDFGKGRFHIRFKLRKGRVKIMSEEFSVDQLGIKFSPISSKDVITAATNSLLPKVQFNLQLSEKERAEKEKVVLPFEHQGDGKPIQIYDGRRTLEESKTQPTSELSGKSMTSEFSTGKGGEIIYFRDSDDENPDSDEDPDDDLDI
ncbi:PREDICTED: elongator complex protein 5 [Tarenaya hassleriana]|uniref:elongator complex protein 5 n=1 Tax=Tarenaya hassleriana TaxID=28532 RepID=UPI00053CA881|nr:PREDICTED: elongator complex protein 5 [Tarenaya hassleriana]